MRSGCVELLLDMWAPLALANDLLPHEEVEEEEELVAGALAALGQLQDLLPPPGSGEAAQAASRVQAIVNGRQAWRGGLPGWARRPRVGSAPAGM